jgi:hypothetical protein
MLTAQTPKKQKTLKSKQLLFVLSPQKYVEHEQALEYLATIPHGMGVHTVAEAINFYAQAQESGEAGVPGSTDARLKVIEEQLQTLLEKKS